jgi:ADP-heptose:LPS heptosyltransferase
MIIISPYAQKLRNGKENPKNYPYWEELIQKIDKSIHIVQVGVEGEIKLVDDCRFNLSIKDLRNLINECHTWISVDSMFQHLAWDCEKKGIVLWSQSNPLIFGHKENINLLKDRLYLRQNQFLWWEDTDHNPDAFVKPEEIIKHL